jgi:hypothetical protein
MSVTSTSATRRFHHASVFAVSRVDHVVSFLSQRLDAFGV